jgi:hypothetical protein
MEAAESGGFDVRALGKSGSHATGELPASGNAPSANALTPDFGNILPTKRLIRRRLAIACSFDSNRESGG